MRLNDLLEGGDAKNEEREKKEAKLKKKYSKYKGYDDKDWDAFDSKWFKEYVNEYTVTIDMKLTELAPREGISLFQTSLIHANENKRSGKTTLSKSDGECMINQAGGVGVFGTFGDTTKAKVEVNMWKRVVVAVKCVEGKDEKGELRTWVNTEAGVVVKEDSISANDRFSIDPDGFFLFSSGQNVMMPGKISIRTIRIESKFSSDADVKANRARDKVLSKYNEDRKAEVELQRKELSLAPLFPKPRPLWSAPAVSYLIQFIPTHFNS